MGSDEARSPNTIIVPRRRAIGLSNDHAGFPLKAFVKALLLESSDEVIDVGANSADPVDFPDVTRKAVSLILDGKVDRVVLVCETGAGACIAANKTAGIRAAVAHDTFVARQCVEHDDVNTLCIGAWIIGQQIAADVVRAFLSAEFRTEEHFRRRVQKLEALERKSGAKR